MNYTLSVLPGDGIGPEVIEQGIKVLDAVGNKYGHEFTYKYGDVGGIAIEKTGSPLPQATIDICLDSDALLFGAIGDPRYDNDPTSKVRPEQGLLGLRKALDLYCNIRPLKIYDRLRHLSPIREENLSGVDFVVYRELIGGIYFGKRGRNDAGDYAFDTCEYHTHEIDRVSRLAFDAAGRRRKKLTLVDKANVLESSRLWRERIQQLASSYPNIEVDYMFVDNAAMQMIVYPAQFDVILTTNMFGDILSDESSVLAGSLGLIPSASIGSKTSMFEPIHGSYPQGAGKDIANPIATVASVAMLLDHLDLNEEGNAVRIAIDTLLESGRGTEDLRGLSAYKCSEVGSILASSI